jgi:hypothetical protein
VRYLLPSCLLTGLVATVGCGRIATKGVTVDSSFRPFIPADTKVLAGVQIAKLQTSPLYVSHREQLDSSQLNAFAERTGLDPARDLSEILISWNGEHALALVRGNFSQSKIQPKLGSLGVHQKAFKKYTLFGDDTNSLVFIRDGLALAGSSQVLRNVLEERGNGETGVPAELQQRMEGIPRSDQMWLVSRGGLPTNGIPMRSEVGSALSNIVGFVSGTSVGITVDTGIHLQGDLGCVSRDGAQRVRDALRGGIGLARLTTKDNQLELLRLYDSIHVDQDNAAVHVRADLAPDLANTLIGYIPEMRNRAGQILQRVP